MSTEIETGGPAFPHVIEGGKDSQLHASFEVGMLLRDFFAAKAMQGICAAGPGHYMTNYLIAKEAYSLADAMIAARDK